jgi:hypothetical protein
VCTRWEALHPLGACVPAGCVCARWEALHPLGGAAPAGRRCTRWEALHPLGGACGAAVGPWAVGPIRSLVVVEPAVDVAGEPAVHACGGGVGQFADVVGDQAQHLDVRGGAIG